MTPRQAYSPASACSYVIGLQDFPLQRGVLQEWRHLLYAAIRPHQDTAVKPAEPSRSQNSLVLTLFAGVHGSESTEREQQGMWRPACLPVLVAGLKFLQRSLFLRSWKEERRASHPEFRPPAKHIQRSKKRARQPHAWQTSCTHE